MNKIGLDQVRKVLQVRQAMKMMLDAFPDNERFQLDAPFLESMVNEAQTIVDCMENDKFFIEGWFATAPEIWTAMDIPWYCMATVAEVMSIDYLLEDLEQCDQLDIPKDLCTLHRLFIRALDAKDLPIPSAFVALLQPCDGIAGVHNVMIKRPEWSKVPFFAIDPPYGETDDQIRYVAEQLKLMVPWLEKISGKKLDMDKLREVCENGNEVVKLFWELNELKRAIPCPTNSFGGSNFAGALTIVPDMIGSQKAIDYCRSHVAYARKLVKAGKGALENEKIRIHWFDTAPVYHTAWGLDMWLEEEMGANIVMAFEAVGSFSLIDTSSEDSMFYGIAKRCIMDSVMIRHSRGNSALELDELSRVVKDYSIDCVIQGGHMGHKDQQAVVGLVREKCRELDVPFLFLGLDNYDPRYMTLDEVKDKITRFFNVMGLG